MKRFLNRQFVVAHILLVILVLITCYVPNQKPITCTYYPLLVAIGIMELLYLANLYAKHRKGNYTTGPTDIVTLLWVAMLGWEISTTKLAVMPNVLVPAPEQVFNIFATNYPTLLNNVWSSVTLLLVGYFIGLSSGVVLGVICGWIPRLRAMFYPIANVMAPIPPTVFAPYLVVIMPTFRLASVCIILIGVFWPQFLSMVLRVSSLDGRILDNARALGVRNTTMITRVILPYVLPGVLDSLRVGLTTAFLMLTFAEMIGAKAGIGFYITNSNIYANYEAMIAGIIVCGIVVTILSALTTWIKKRFTTWR
ncbi:MAG: ABC transporter permease subunit [Coriobacteriia bacterium]|nr:ABC transporter permease subunit [Coriobacteriia bacterium]